MLNADMVNMHFAGRNRAHFCVFLLDLCRFLLFKNPVKYDPIFGINHNCTNTTHRAATSLLFVTHIQWVTP